MQRVLVLSNTKQPLMPCHPARARELLNDGKAAVFRKYPFTIILKERDTGVTQPVELKIDPGSKTTGMALVTDTKSGKLCVFGINLEHRGQQIKDALQSRSMVRRARRNRNTRYRQPRFLNRTRKAGWLPPSIMSRVYNTQTWIDKLVKFTPVSSFGIEIVKFDMQKMTNPDIHGKEYQQGTLFQYEIKEYLLELHNRTCMYCEGLSKNSILEIEHKVPRSRGGTNNISNLGIACRLCNQKKSNLFLSEWFNVLKDSARPIDKKILLNIPKIIKGIKRSLKDAAAVNATRRRISDYCLKEYSLPITLGTGAQTKFNRAQQKYTKDHWIDAACATETGSKVFIPKSSECLVVIATGHGNRQMCKVNKYGFPRTNPKGPSKVFGFQTGDITKIKNEIGRVVVRAIGYFDININNKLFNYKYSLLSLIHKTDGFKYTKPSVIKTLILDNTTNINKFIINIIKKHFTILNIVKSQTSVIVKIQV